MLKKSAIKGRRIARDDGPVNHDFVREEKRTTTSEPADDNFGQREIEIASGSLAGITGDALDAGQPAGILDIGHGQVFVVGAALCGQRGGQAADNGHGQSDEDHFLHVGLSFREGISCVF